MERPGEHSRPTSNSRKPLRARKACSNCQARKSRCVQTYEDACDRCRRNRKACVYIDFPQTAPASQSPKRVAATPRIQVPSSSLSNSGGRLWQTNTSPAAESTDAVTDFLSGHVPNHAGRRTRVERGFLTQIRRLMFLDPVPSRSRDRSRHRRQSEESSSSNEPEDEAYINAAAIFPPKEVAEYLLSVAIQYAIDSFFYFDQQDMHRLLMLHYSNTPRKANPSFVCLALSTFAFGMQWAHLDGGANEPANKATDAADAFAAKAQALIPGVLIAPSSDAVSACLLLCLYLLTTVSTDSAYSYLGIALRIAISGNMHKESLLSEFTACQAESRHRLWWTIYSLERTIGIKLGRPEAIQERDVSTPMPKLLAELDDVQMQDNLSQQIANATLVRIWSRIANALPLIYAGSDQYNHDIIEGLVEELNNWKSTLPEGIQLHNLNPLDKGYRGKMHLHQNYSHALIILFRSPLVAVARQRLSKAFAPHDDLADLDSQALSLSIECRNAARDMIANIDRVRQAKLLARFSWTDFQGCSTAILITLLYRVIEHDLDYDHIIETGLYNLKVLAEASKPAQLALNFVLEFKKIVEEAVQRSQQPEQVSNAADGQRQNYKKWLASLSAQKGSSVNEATENPNLSRETGPGLPGERHQMGYAGGGISIWDSGGENLSLPEMSLESDFLFDESQILSLSGMDFLASSLFAGDHLHSGE